MRTCLKNSRENGKNAKMNSSTQKYFTAENVWKTIFENLTEKITKFNTFYIEKSK